MKYKVSPSNNNAICNAVNVLLLDSQVKSASVYQSPYLVITATRRGKSDKRRNNLETVLTIGRPNYRGRKFIRTYLKAGEPFPVRRVIVKYAKGMKV